MKAEGLRAARERAGVSRQELARAAEVSVSQIEAWESSGSVPRGQRHRLDLTLWEIERDRTLARSGLPECAELRDLAGPDGLDPETAMRHLETCPHCEQISEYVRTHVRPMPEGGPLTFRILAVVERMSGWARSAAYGALLLLMMGGLGVVWMLAQALLRRDPTYLGYAVALFVVLVVSGAAGGTVHYLTGPLRRTGTPGHYLSYVLTVLGYMLAASGLIGLGAWATGDTETIQDMPSLSDPGELAILLGISVFFGIVVGRSARSIDESPIAAPPQQRRVLSGRNIAIALLTVGALALQILARHAGPAMADDLQAAMELYDEGRLVEADSAYTAILRERPEDPYAHQGRAWVLLRTERPTESEREFREAIRLDPGDPWLHRDLATLFKESGRTREALTSLRSAAELDPEDAVLWVDLARVAHLTGDYAESAAAFARAEELEPGLMANAPVTLGMWEASKQGRRYDPAGGAKAVISDEPRDRPGAN